MTIANLLIKSREEVCSLPPLVGFVIFLSFFNQCLTMGAIPQKWIFACVDCGCIFTTMAEKQTGICPVCKSTDRNQIEGFNY